MNNTRITIIGLGYVGLPLARLFATKYPVVGFDINQKRVEQLKNGIDETLEIDEHQLNEVLVHDNPVKEGSIGLYCTNSLNDISTCNVYIITVPTPVDDNKNPVLNPLIHSVRQLNRYELLSQMLFQRDDQSL